MKRLGKEEKNKSGGAGLLRVQRGRAVAPQLVAGSREPALALFQLLLFRQKQVQKKGLLGGLGREIDGSSWGMEGISLRTIFE